MKASENKKSQILLIPNILSLVRIILIPLIVLAFLAYENRYLTISLIALSGLTDVFDGIIARKFNMVSDLGKILDPIADKLTLGSILICLALRYELTLLLIKLFVAKETAMSIMGLITVRKTGKINSSKWYGKINAVTLYAVTGILILFPDVAITSFLVAVCIASTLFSLFMYAIYFVKSWQMY